MDGQRQENEDSDTDHLSRDEVSSRNLHSVDDEVDSGETPSHITRSSSKETIRMGNALYAKYNQPRCLEREVYNALIAIGVESSLIDDAYLFLTAHHFRMRQFLGVPFDSRKRILEKLMNSPPQR